MKFGDIPAYFEHSIKPYRYDKIVMVCDKGQVSSYTTMLLRLMGYGNVYSMRWGMSAWNPDLAAVLPVVHGMLLSDLNTNQRWKRATTLPLPKETTLRFIPGKQQARRSSGKG